MTPLTYDELAAMRDDVLRQLAGLPARSSFSDQGRSTTYDRGGLLQQLAALNKQLAAMPWVLYSGARV